MKRKKNINKKDSITMAYSNERTIQDISDKLISLLPIFPHEFIIVCIGTDRSTGDALGPLTGTYLNEFHLRHMNVLGTLHDPIHAQNLTDCITKINDKYKKPFIIAIDASLGRTSSIGNITLGVGPLFPGAALNKKLPIIGDLHITAVVNVSGYMEYAVLQNTRLSIVSDMAITIASILKKVDHQLTATQRLCTSISHHGAIKENPLQMTKKRERFSN